jgi:antitoxin (DNA-binding transcriptional repressor) of toxin-antitoxin stability system
MNASIVDLRYKMKDVLRAIDRGETVTVLYRGKAKAKLMPMTLSAEACGGGPPRTEDQPFFGLWGDREDLTDPASYLRNLRRTRSVVAQARGKGQASAKKTK